MNGEGGDFLDSEVSQQPTSSLTQILSSSLTSLDQFTPDLKGLDTKGRMLQIE